MVLYRTNTGSSKAIWFGFELFNWTRCRSQRKYYVKEIKKSAGADIRNVHIVLMI